MRIARKLLSWINQQSLINKTPSFYHILRIHSDCCKMPTAENTEPHLQKLRLLMKTFKTETERLDAYIIPSGDAHQSEYVAKCDKRRDYISGFTGSSGTAIVTEDKAALWTDGRYFLQASKELDDNWTLVKEGIPNAITQGVWLSKNLPDGSRIGVDPFLISSDSWKLLLSQLDTSGMELVPVTENLVDLVWEEKPSRPCTPIIPLPVKYTGLTWQEKVSHIREKMDEKKAFAVVLTALDDIAWLLNLRGSDIDYNPVFFAYLILTTETVYFFIDENRISPVLKEHLASSENSSEIVIFEPYNEIKDFLSKFAEETQGKIWVSSKSSYGIHRLIPEKRRLIDTSPVTLAKAVKSYTEISGLKQAHIRDAVALCEYFAWLETEVPKRNVTEISGAKRLEEFRREQQDYVGLSFPTISASGPNGAIIHYRPNSETDRLITDNELYLCDSGAQYRDGTTDVTRTVHFGTPSDYEVECFTRVLKGHIALSLAVFPKQIRGQLLDTLARTALWEAGLDYLHGTGHGVGAYLNVHEGPMGIVQQPLSEDPGLQEGMVLSNEPGYYEAQKFGIRIENVQVIKKSTTKYNVGFLTFEPITLVPIQTKLVDPTLLTSKEIEWLNSYHQLCREIVGKALEDQGRVQAKNWLIKETQPLG